MDAAKDNKKEKDEGKAASDSQLKPAGSDSEEKARDRE